MKKILIVLLLIMLSISSKVFAKEEKMTRSDIANKNLETLFNISLENNKGPDKDFMDILQKYIFGEVFEVGELDIKTRELLTVTTLACMQTLPQLKAHINGALNAGNTPIEIRETIYQCAPFIGFPKTLNAISVFNEVIKERGLENELKSTAKTTEADRYTKGFEIQNPLYGDEIKENFKNLPDNMGSDVARFLTEVCFGDYYTREGLDLKTRELMTIAILTTTKNFNTLKSHIKGNLKAGNNIETITASIIQIMPYIGFPDAFQALNIIKELNIKDYNLQKAKSAEDVDTDEMWIENYGYGYPKDEKSFNKSKKKLNKKNRK